MVNRIIGRDPRVLICDEWGAWQELDLVDALGDLGGRVLIGLDLAAEPLLLPPMLEKPVSELAT